MKYFAGDIVKFRLKSGEVQEGEVLFVENEHNEDVLYINAFNRQAYRVNEKSVISPEKNKLIQWRRLGKPAV